jgi:nucleotide-binding universal stress UspA family protein
VETILIAADGPDSLAALAPAAEIAQRWQGNVVVVHTGGLEDAERSRIHALIDELRSSGVEADLELPSASVGPASAIIVESAQRRGASVILLATGPCTAAGRGGGRSITQSVLDAAPCRVVVVPPPSILERPARAAGGSG